MLVHRGWGKFGPIAVGLVVPLLMWLEGPVSSMCINPARAFGPALILWSWRQHWIFWTAPFLGGIPAGVIYSQLFAAECAELHAHLFLRMLHQVANVFYKALPTFD